MQTHRALPSPKPVFARWLIDQIARSDDVGALAKAAKADAAFPKNGDAMAVSMRLNAVQADSDMHAALEHAECDYHAY